MKLVRVRSHIASLMILMIIAASFGPSRSIATAAPERQDAFPPGAVVALENTPHLFVADDDGVLHWMGDPRAVLTQFVDWDTRREVSVEQLKTLRLGSPYLSANFLSYGDDGPIYLARWEDSRDAPRLLHIQCVSDLALFGVNAENWDQFVSPREAWEAVPHEDLFLTASALETQELAPADPTAPSCATTNAHVAPRIEALSPTSGPASGGTTVTITGAGFQPGSRVRLGQCWARDVSFRSDTILVVVTAACNEGLNEVRLWNPDYQTAVAPGGFIYSCVPLTSVGLQTSVNADARTIEAAWNGRDGCGPFDGFIFACLISTSNLVSEWHYVTEGCRIVPENVPARFEPRPLLGSRVDGHPVDTRAGKWEYQLPPLHRCAEDYIVEFSMRLQDDAGGSAVESTIVAFQRDCEGEE